MPLPSRSIVQQTFVIFAPAASLLQALTRAPWWHLALVEVCESALPPQLWSMEVQVGTTSRTGSVLNYDSTACYRSQELL